MRFDESLFKQLYFGTPYIAYQERILQTLKLSKPTHQHILGAPVGPYFDLQSAEVDGVPAFAPGGKTHQLIEILFRDFYKPIGIGGLASALFEGERFDIETSPDRVHQVIRRARLELKNSRVPLQILAQAKDYSVHADASLRIALPLERETVAWEFLQLNKLELALGRDRAFTAAEARDQLDLTPAAFKRLASWAIEHGHLERFGAGPSTTYTRI